MYSVGLTGGIASGKTTISDLFAGHGVAIVDTDIISRRLLEPGERGFDQVMRHFGEAIADDRGGIDRRRLREIVFTDERQKSWLETMLHPLIFERSHAAILAVRGSPYVLVVVPLLFETNFQSLVDRILVVSCPAERQIERLVRRDRISVDLAEKMLARQLDNAARLKRAHDVIDNSGDGSDLAAQVDRLHARYLELAHG